MKNKNWVTIILINLVVGLIIVSPFLPGPSNDLVNLLFDSGQMLGIFGLIIIPVGLIWTIKELRRKRNDEKHQVDTKALLLLTLPITIFVTSIFLSGLLRNFSRNFAINRTEDLIQSLEEFKVKKGNYPDSLVDLTPEFITSIPSPFIMGINNYYYKMQGDAYTISFTQNVTMGFNFEVVTFDPTDNHKAEGKTKGIYDTGKRHWKYYIFD